MADRPRRREDLASHPRSRAFRTTVAAIVVAIAAVLGSGCSGGSSPRDVDGARRTGGSDTSTDTSTSSTDEPARAGTSARADPSTAPSLGEVINIAEIPRGRPPRANYLAAGVLRWHGRTTPTDFPAHTFALQLLGAVDGRVAVSASDERFWSIDPTGHATRLGRTHRSYDHSPLLVASTGHLWAYYQERTTPRTIWEIDARTGRQLAAYPHDRVPRDLAPADQALVDAWVEHEDLASPTAAATQDGTLVAGIESARLGVSSFGTSVVVRRSTDHHEVARFTFLNGFYEGVTRVLFERHTTRPKLLVLVDTSLDAHPGQQQVIVRCSVRSGACQKATRVDHGNGALGTIRPRFTPDPP